MDRVRVRFIAIVKKEKKIDFKKIQLQKQFSNFTMSWWKYFIIFSLYCTIEITKQNSHLFSRLQLTFIRPRWVFKEKDNVFKLYTCIKVHYGIIFSSLSLVWFLLCEREKKSDSCLELTSIDILAWFSLVKIILDWRYLYKT